MSSTFNRIVFGIAVVLLVPILFNPLSWPIFGVAALLVVVGAFAARELLDLEKYRRQGERASAHDVRYGGRDP